MGLLVESHEGRPTKIEGNPDHPSSRGATDLFAQASILGLYDPDRSTTITNLGDIEPFSAFVAAMRSVLAAQLSKKGAGFRILTETIASPTMGAQIDDILTRLPAAKAVQWEPFFGHNAREGGRLAFNEYVAPQYAIEKADVILSLDADFMCVGAAGLRHARAFASRRRAESTGTRNRLYAVESTPTNSGSRADHRLPLKASDIESLVRALASKLSVPGVAAASVSDKASAFLESLATDLQAARGKSLVLAGDSQPASVHAVVHAINAALGNVGQTVTYTQTPEARPGNQLASLRELVGEMNAGTVDFLLILGGNPVYTAPADLKFGDALAKVRLRAHVGQYEDETAEKCQWHVPETHYLEMWSDVRADDGTVTIVQPLIAPLYNGKSPHEILAAFAESGGERPGYDIVREYWAKQTGLSTAAPAALPLAVATPVPAPATPKAPPVGAAAGAPAAAPAPPAAVAAAPKPALSPFDLAWRRWLHDGMVPDTAFAIKQVTLQAAMPPAANPTGDGLEIVFRPDPSVHDGRYSNNAWLQELPKSLTKLTWDNAALIAPSTMTRLGLSDGDVVDLRQGGQSVRIAAWTAHGQAPDTITLHLGYGRTRAGRVGTGIGFAVNALRTSSAPDTLAGVQLTKTGDSYELACTQDHWSLEGRNLIRVATQAQYTADPSFAAKMQEEAPKTLTMLPPRSYEGYAWGMAIDQNVCTGCNACVVACQSENNVPVVGKSQVANGREMHWLRVDRYYTGEIDNPDTYHQPMPCQQCESAPCEVVCPVAATTHSDEGLNDMVYNRCVGTRYCSNNCPFKVRRFNFLLYGDWESQSLMLQRNPDVTVRSRGVMEKCTYCVQRINQARVAAKLDDREIRDGEVVTACQSACPTEAIVFGNLNDPNSRVSKLKANTLNYRLLEELNIRPRTSYMAVVRNPNTTLEPASATNGEERG